jgi:hypothetical protein
LLHRVLQINRLRHIIRLFKIVPGLLLFLLLLANTTMNEQGKDERFLDIHFSGKIKCFLTVDEILRFAQDDMGRELRLIPMGCPLRSPKWLPMLLKLIWLL